MRIWCGNVTLALKKTIDISLGNFRKSQKIKEPAGSNYSLQYNNKRLKKIATM